VHSALADISSRCSRPKKLLPLPGKPSPAQGLRVTVAKEFALSIDEISGNDINGGGTPDVVFDAFTGGEQCCYLYWIVSLRRSLKLFVKFATRCRLSSATPGRRHEIRTGEGSFDLFFLPHSASVLPQLCFVLTGSTGDISSEYREEYDQQIAKARSELSAADLEKSASPATTRKCSLTS